MYNPNWRDGLMVLALAALAVNAEESATTPAAEITVVRSDTGQAVSPAAAQAALATTSLSVSLDTGGEFNAYGLVLSARVPSRLFVNASSELVTAAVVEGEVNLAELGDIPASEAALLIVATGERRRVSFDAARLAASLPAAARTELDASLQSLAQIQKKRRWWGYYVPLGLNAQAPVPREIEALRRQYLLDPAVVAVRSEAAGNLDAQRRGVATRFVTALAAGDSATVAVFLDPEPFVRDGGGWRETRNAYARQLSGSPLSAALRTASVDALPDAGNRFRVAAAGAEWTLTTTERDNMTFVSALAPVEKAALEPQAATAAAVTGVSP